MPTSTATCYAANCTGPGTHVLVGHEEANHDAPGLCTLHVVAALAEALADTSEFAEIAFRVEPVGFDPYA